jgi:hypothetical protein
MKSRETTAALRSNTNGRTNLVSTQEHSNILQEDSTNGHCTNDSKD